MLLTQLLMLLTQLLMPLTQLLMPLTQLLMHLLLQSNYLTNKKADLRVGFFIRQIFLLAI